MSEIEILILFHTRDIILAYMYILLSDIGENKESIINRIEYY